MIILAFVHKGYMSYYTTYLMHTHSVHTSLLLFVVLALARLQCGVLLGSFWSYCLCLEHGPLHSAGTLDLNTMQFRLWFLNPCCMNAISRIWSWLGWIRHEEGWIRHESHDEQAKKLLCLQKSRAFAQEFLHMHWFFGLCIMQKLATKSDTLGHCLLWSRMNLRWLSLSPMSQFRSIVKR